MNKKELQKYRAILLEKQKILAMHIQSMGESVLQNPSRDLTNLPTHIADLSTDTYSQNLTIELLENKEGVMKDIADALTRIDEGTFGICRECGREIPPRRLDYIPFTRLCVNCKTQEEKRQSRLCF